MYEVLMGKLTTSQAAKALGVHRLTLLRWLHDHLVPEPENIFIGNVRYRFFRERDMRRLRKFQAKLHPRREAAK